MPVLREQISDEEVALLRELLGKRPGSILGSAFIIDVDLVCSLRFALYTGKGDPHQRYVTIASIQLETPVEYLDWGRFVIGCVDSLEDAFTGAAELYRSLSMLVIPEAVTVTRVRLRRARVGHGEEEVEYDAFIALDLSDGRTISFGHAPGVWGGACVTLGKPQTLGDPTDVWDGLVLGPEVSTDE